uniref:Uncharacterized protein n=1 Tax=Strix occidentalis caurina TaxID=311401 RepID=A0A8D0F3A9_STROC
MKQGAPGPEGRSRFQKVSLVSRQLESTGSTRGREGSPSRVSLLLQAWEREIVEKTASGPTTLTQRERPSSINLLKDFAAHGPIFSQVYSPTQKPRRQDERGKVGASGGGDGIPPPVGAPQEMPSSPEPPTEPPAPDPPAESPPDTTEEDPELLVDMEIFVDTLRNMEPSEMRKVPKAPRQPRPSSLGRCTALPPIQEDRVAPRAPISLPEALRELLVRGPVGRREETSEEEAEIENPYLTPEERASGRTLHGVPRDSVADVGQAEGDSLLRTLRQAGAEEKAKPVAGGSAKRSVPFRGNVLKGMALLSHFLEHRAVAADEGKPYSRLDNSMLYSRFVSPSAPLIELPGRDGRGTGSPTPGDNGQGPGDHPGPEMAVLEALSPGCVPLVAEEPESTMSLCPADVLVSESHNTAPGEMLGPPGHAGRWWGLSPGTSFPGCGLCFPSEGESPWCDRRVLGWVMGGYWDG